MFGKKKDKKAECALNATASVASGYVATQTAEKTEAFNAECRQYRTELKAEDMRNSQSLAEKLKTDPGYTLDRQKAVDTAYRYEKADVKMGGSGSAHFNASEKTELLNTGRVRGMEGHHINSVTAHPELQTRADNVKFFRGRKEHLNEGHGGDFRNESSGPLIDRDKMLHDTNMKRVAVNEAKGAGTAVAFGAAAGVTSSVIGTCKEEGVSMKSVKKGVKKSGKPVVFSAGSSGLSYLATRIISHIFFK